MTTLYEGAFAKLNLTLDVLGKREDGYHDLQSVMQTISIRDDIEIDVGTGKPWVLTCDKEGIPCDERNLAWKAAKLFEDVTGKDLGGIEIRIIVVISVVFTGGIIIDLEQIVTLTEVMLAHNALARFGIKEVIC